MGLISRRRSSSKNFTPSRPSPLAEGALRKAHDPGASLLLDPLIRPESCDEFFDDFTDDDYSDQKGFLEASSMHHPHANESQVVVTPLGPTSFSQDAAIPIKSDTATNLKSQCGNSCTYAESEEKNYEEQQGSASNSAVNSSSPLETNIGAPIDIYALLKEFSLFKNAPLSFFSALVHKLKPLHVPPQRFILTQGDEAKTMYWIVKGNVGITSRDGETTYAELQPGHFFGEIGLLFDRPRTANAISRSKCLLMSLSADSLNAILPSFPSVERAIRDEAQERLVVLERVKKSLSSASETDSERENHDDNDKKPNHHAVSVGDKRRFSESDFDSDSEINTDDENDRDELETENVRDKTVFYNTISEDDGVYDYVISMERAKKRRLGALDEVHSPISTTGTSLSTPIAAFIDQPSARLGAKTTKTGNANFYSHLNNTPFLFLKDILKELPLFQNLPSHILHELAMSVEPVTYPAFDYIFKQGSTGKDIYFIVQGTAEVLLEPSPDTKEARHLATLKEGSYVGEMAFLSMSPYRTASVRTVTQVDCLVITESTLTSLCGGFPDIQTEFLKTAAQRKLKNPALIKPKSVYDVDTAPVSISAIQAPASLDISKEVAVTFDPASQAAAAAAVAVVSATYGASRFASFLNPRRKSSNDTSTFRRRGSRFNIGIFPASVLLNIFQFLDLPYLMKLQLVCQQWRHILLHSKSLMNTLNLSKYNTRVNDQSIVSIINFSGTRPKEVDISNCFHLTDDGFYFLVNSIGLSQVKKFKMRSVWEVSGMSIMDLSVPSVGSELEEIDLSNCRKADDLTVIRLVGWVVSHTGVDGVTPITFPPPGTVVGCPKLKRISFGYCKNITDRTMFHIAAYASDRLETLDMTRCTSITDVGFSYWNTKQFPKLTKINLSDCTFLSDKAIMDLTKSSPYLEDMNLSFCCALSDIAVETIGVNCPNLKTLNLSFCGSAVSDKSLAVLAHRLPYLEHLSVRGCVRVTNSSLDLLWKMCPSLKTLNTTQCKNVVPCTYPREYAAHGSVPFGLS